MTGLLISDLINYLRTNKVSVIVDPKNSKKIFVCPTFNNFVSIEHKDNRFHVVYCDDKKTPLLNPSNDFPLWNSGCILTTSLESVHDLIKSKNDGKHYS
jgi:hypothetical protein